eukprot:TRINITY_DN1395_c0_g1_i1.p1 TRINITY_DN1395_c0_g1~~TRINITY_DN1395_c0_g1_i1.p1  ORF type:complete len:207 (-),score=47.14 TRINITY_DN1395_c0_g1_i1:65-685(-)
MSNLAMTDADIQAAVTQAKEYAENASGWSVVNDKDGAVLDSKQIAGSDINAFRVKGNVRASPEKLIDLVWSWGESDWKKWASDIESWQVLETPNENTRIIHQVNKLSWPLWSRDVVFLCSRQSLDNGAKLLVLKSVENSKAPPQKDKYVRANILTSFFLFEPIEGGHSKVTRVLHVDPAGNIPTSVVNASAKATHGVIDSFNKLVA